MSVSVVNQVASTSYSDPQFATKPRQGFTLRQQWITVLLPGPR
uniref:Uncharacterized protein n=1 Tax=Anguilla anguilla TaxID=7936 RepID=A0A0E9QEN5_ANGAN